MNNRITGKLLLKANKYLYKHVYQLRPIIRNDLQCPLIECKYTAFQSLVRSIISQQLSNKAADVIFTRLIEAVGGINSFYPEILLHFSSLSLKKIGISQKKVEYILNLAKIFMLKKININLIEQLSDKDVITELTKIKGIGQWTAEMFLIFYLRRPDVVAVTDVGLKRAVQNIYKLDSRPGDEKLIEISDQWRPYRSIACWYLWQSLKF